MAGPRVEPAARTLDMERKLTAGDSSRITAGSGYSAVVGTHLIASLLNYNQPNVWAFPASLNIFTNSGRNLLNTTFDNGNRLVQNAGFTKPYDEFPSNFILARSLRPYPQYNNITTSSGGDHSGHSSYHSLVVKVTRRYSAGLVIDESYVLSKMFTDADTMWANSSPASLDHQPPAGKSPL